MTNEELRQRLTDSIIECDMENYVLEVLPERHSVIRTAEIIADYIIANGVTIRERGEWKEVYQNKQATVYECSKCHHLSFGTSDYCICGADMRGVKDE